MPDPEGGDPGCYGGGVSDPIGPYEALEPEPQTPAPGHVDG